MSDSDKIKKIEDVTSKLKAIAGKSIRKGNFRKALDAITAASFILEEYNQYYVDDDLEKMTDEISEKLVKTGFTSEETDDRTVLYYDSFGFDVRALALVYMHALSDLGYRVIYITKIESKDSQPELHRAVEGGDVIWRYVSLNDREKEVREINSIFEEFKPSKAILYSTPDDAAAVSVFKAYKGIVTRFKINLTDHAFWLGPDSFDYSLEFRNYGACVSYKYRGVPEDKLILMPFYPYHRPREFGGLPFDPADKKIMFSGGSLYKTLGDPQNRYYRIADALLSGHDDLIFLYAGTGDDSEIKKIQDRYPGRAFRIDERPDLYELMEHCTIYLNTFPFIGGLMMQFACDAGKVPLTLKSEGSDDQNKEIIPDQESIEYDSVEELVKEAGRLLTDEKYRLERGRKLRDEIMSPDRFRDELSRALTSHNTTYEVKLRDIDTTDFRKQYIIRFNDSNFRKVIASGNKKTLIPDFPGLFIKKAFNKVFRKENLNN